MIQEHNAHINRKAASRHASVITGFILMLRQQHQEEHNIRRIFATKYKLSNDQNFNSTRLSKLDHDHDHFEFVELNVH